MNDNQYRHSNLLNQSVYQEQEGKNWPSETSPAAWLSLTTFNWFEATREGFEVPKTALLPLTPATPPAWKALISPLVLPTEGVESARLLVSAGGGLEVPITTLGWVAWGSRLNFWPPALKGVITPLVLPMAGVARTNEKKIETKKSSAFFPFYYTFLHFNPLLNNSSFKWIRSTHNHLKD